MTSARSTAYFARSIRLAAITGLLCASALALTWFAKLKELSSTRYYKEVLKECSTFHTWSGK